MPIKHRELAEEDCEMRIQRFARGAVVAVVIATTLGAPTASAGDIVPRRDGSKAVDVPVVLPAPTNSDAADRFDVGDAGAGAAGMLAAVLALAGVASLRVRRRPMEAR